MCLKIPMLQGLVKIHQAKKQGGRKVKQLSEKVPEAKSGSKLMTSLIDGRKSGEALSMSRKCCHSRVYHKALKAALNDNKTKADAKDLARKAGKKFYEEFDVSYCKADA
jgi:DNA-binding protein YbaB